MFAASSVSVALAGAGVPRAEPALDEWRRGSRARRRPVLEEVAGGQPCASIVPAIVAPEVVTAAPSPWFAAPPAAADLPREAR
jgi:hypothetical protein